MSDTARESPASDSVLLVAGASGPERLPPRRDTSAAEWHQPEHVRDRAAARGRLTAAAEAGADVIVAPAYLTHRRALSPYGETRRAAEWTREAVDVAREAAELAQERAAAAPAAASPQDAEQPPRPTGSPRPRALVAGPMGPLQPGRFEGPLDPGVIADEDRERADLLVDAGAELLLIESMPSLAEARSAVQAATSTGAPFWLGLQLTPSGAHLPSGDALEALWQELADARPAAALVAPRSLAAADAALDAVSRLAGVPVGLWLDASGAEWAALEQAAADGSGPQLTARLAAWLDAGASIVGLSSGATPGRLRTIRAVTDERTAATAERQAARERAWLDAVEDAALRASGARALWLGAAAPAALPDRFAWTVLPSADHRGLPDRAFGLAVIDDPEPADLAAYARVVDDGGYLLLGVAAPPQAIPEHLSVQRLDQAAGRHVVLLRRRP